MTGKFEIAADDDLNDNVREELRSVMKGQKNISRLIDDSHKRFVIHEIEIPEPDVAAIRKTSGLSQSEFAKSTGVALGTLQGWEQGRRKPRGAARVLLALIAKRPGIVQDELQKISP